MFHGSICKHTGVKFMNSYIFPKSIGSFLPTYAYQALIKEFIPCGFVIDDSLSILHIFGTAGEFIFHEEGLVKLNILSMISNQLKVLKLLIGNIFFGVLIQIKYQKRFE